MPRISFTVTHEEKELIENYVHNKHRWRDPAALARDAFWQTIARNPLWAEKKKRSKSAELGG